MTEAFYAVLKASFQGSVVILAVLLLRQLLKKAPKSVFCLLWLLAGLRLVLPFEIESRLSLQPDYTPVVESVMLPENSPENVPDYFDSVPDLSDQPEFDLEELPAVTHPLSKPLREKLTFDEIAAPVWLAGVGIMVLASIWSYWKLKRRVRMAYLIENGCFECPGLDTAFVLGFLPPRIYLPAGLTEGEKKFIFDHENTHIARGDHWFKLLGYLVLSLHWFNPLVWIGYSLLCRDIELACDEQVVKFMSLNERKAYSSALLSCGSHTSRIAACPVAFGESNPKHRILNVLNYKRPGFWISLTAVIAVIFVAACLLTNPGNPSLLEFGNVVDEEIHDIGIHSKNGLAAVSHLDDIREIQKLLKSVSWEKDAPTERPDQPGAYALLINSLLAEDALYFSEDCALVWAENTQAYPVSDARKLQEYLDGLTEAVRNRETFGAPFANIGQPVQWLQGITENAVREAEIYVEQPTVQEGNTSSTTRSMGVLSARDFRALLEILNGLPENAIVSESTLRRQSFGALVGSLTPHGGMTLTVWDDVNGLVMVLRLVKDDVIEFILIDELDKAEDGITYLDRPKCWILENDGLLAFLKEMQAYPTIIMKNVSSEGHPETDTPGTDETEPAWNMDMTEEEFMELCRNAVAELQSRENYHISENLIYYVNGKEDARTHAAYWGDGTNWARQSYIPRTEETNTHLYFDGQLYSRVQKDEGNPTWKKLETDHDPRYGLTWLHLLRWEAQLISFEHAEQVEDVLHVFATVHSTVQPLGWDDVNQYTVGFFFDRSGRLTNALMGAVRDGINVMSDLKIEITSADSVRTKLEQMAQQRPADLVQELEDEYYSKSQLIKCAEALRKCQEQGYWNIEENRYFPDGGSVNDTSSCVWYISGNSLLCQNAIPEDAGHWDVWQMCHESNSYHREEFVTNGPEFGQGWKKEWNKGLYNSTSVVLTPWPLRFDWSAAKIAYAETEQHEDGETITFSVLGDPMLQNGEAQNYLVAFHLDIYGNLEYIRMWYLVSEGISLQNTIIFRATSREDVLDYINQCHAEALWHTEGICNDPDCTDSTHHHEGHHH